MKRTTKAISIIGSTGSIGQSTLRVLEAHPGKFKVIGLAAKSNAEALLDQAIRFKPKMVCLYETEKALWLEAKLKKLNIKLVVGDEGLSEISCHPDVEQVIFAAVGAVGLKSLFDAVEAGKNVAVANKEPLVMAGELLMQRVKEKGVYFLPIDSEHSGLWQCLEGKSKESIGKLFLTSSGGPFLKNTGSLKNITPEKALKHPKWKMGPKITIDSATLMNKGLEVIEAANLFDMPVGRVGVLIHPQAVVHALIEFVDGSILAQMGITDMRLPIQYALSYPSRLVNTLPTLDLTREANFEFKKPDFKRFPCLEFGYAAKRAGGTMPAVLNAANEIAVDKFLDRKIGFTDIPKTIEKVMHRHIPRKNPSLNQIIESDIWAREEAERVTRTC